MGSRSRAEIQVDAWGHRLWTVPPNSQGYLTLAASWIASQLDIPTDSSDPMFTHLLAEAAKQAGFDRPEVLHQDADGAQLVSEERLASRAAAQTIVAATEAIRNGTVIAGHIHEGGERTPTTIMVSMVGR